MRVLGIDFTSSPNTNKRITCITCTIDGTVLRQESFERWSSFENFERALQRRGPWIAGIDFPFGQARRFIENIGWPNYWVDYVKHAESLGRDGFVAALNAYKERRPYGDKEHRRTTDDLAGSISPQKLHGVPVGKMFFEGARRLINADVTIPGLRDTGSDRIVVESYPGILVRGLPVCHRYKSEARRKQSECQRRARINILVELSKPAFKENYGLSVFADRSLADDPTGDDLDALLCAVQAAWAWTKRHENFGMPNHVNRGWEGWIADPTLLRKSVTMAPSK